MQREVELEGGNESHREVGNDVVEAVTAVKLQASSGPQSAGSELRFLRGHKPEELRHWHYLWLPPAIPPTTLKPSQATAICMALQSVHQTNTKTNMKVLHLLSLGLLCTALVLPEAPKLSFLQQNSPPPGSYVVEDADDGNTQSFTYRDLRNYQEARNGPPQGQDSLFVLQDRDDNTVQTFSYDEVQRYFTQN
jgi:hypothetical protein